MSNPNEGSKRCVCGAVLRIVQHVCPGPAPVRVTNLAAVRAAEGLRLMKEAHEGEALSDYEYRKLREQECGRELSEPSEEDCLDYLAYRERQLKKKEEAERETATQPAPGEPGPGELTTPNSADSMRTLEDRTSHPAEEMLAQMELGELDSSKPINDAPTQDQLEDTGEQKVVELPSVD